MLKLKLLFLGVAAGTTCAAQQSLVLQDVVSMAQKSSPSFYRAQSQALNSLYAYRFFRSGQLPQLVLNVDNQSSFLGQTRNVEQPDGTVKPVRIASSNLGLGLSLQQQVALTGGTFSVRSDYSRFDQFNAGLQAGINTTPFSINYSQPSIMYNPYRWDRLVAPLAYEASKRKYVEDLEVVALDASGYFFRALNAQSQEKILQLNVKNTDTLYQISKGRFELGKIAENELLQIELNLLNARNNLEQATLDKEIAYQELKRFLNMPKDAEISLVPPVKTPMFNVPLDKAAMEAGANRQSVLEFRRRRLEADESVASARGNNGYRFDVNAQLGKSGTATLPTGQTIPGQVQQGLYVNVGIPIMDWGRARNRVRQAKANRDLMEIDIQQAERTFEQEIYLQTQQFNIQQKLLTSAAKADTIAQLRYEITKQRYLIGKISITDLNLAQQEKDQAAQGYVNALRNFWNAFYTVRRLTLYDFEKDVKIRYEFAE